MTGAHSSGEKLAQPRRGSQEYREGYAEARRAYLIGQADEPGHPVGLYFKRCVRSQKES